MVTMTDLPWRDMRPLDAANLLAGIRAPWWIAGGWALEMFRGTVTRSHSDLDVGVFRRDLSIVLERLSSWQIFEAKDGCLTRLEPGALPRADVSSLWARPAASDFWTIQLMLDEAEGHEWVYRRDPRIRCSLANAIRRSAGGISYLAPEIQLLYKSNGSRECDEIDFVQTWPLMSDGARRWLRDALELVTPAHGWIVELTESQIPNPESLVREAR